MDGGLGEAETLHFVSYITHRHTPTNSKAVCQISFVDSKYNLQYGCVHVLMECTFEYARVRFYDHSSFAV